MNVSSIESILVFGRDARLLETRQWVLETAGFRVLVALEPCQLCELVVSQSWDLLLLCHSLSSAERQEAVATAKSAKPEMRYLIITAQTPIHTIGHLEATVSCFDGPMALIVAIRRLIYSNEGRVLG